MESVLIVASSEKTRQFLLELLKESNTREFEMASSSSEARRILVQKEFDLIVINTPISDEVGIDLGIFATTHTTSGVLLMVKAEEADEVGYKVEDFGVFVIAKPVSKMLFYQSLKMISASRKRLRTLQTQNLKLQQKIEAIRLVNQAKCAMIQYLNMSEEEAHRYIEKQAMDRRMTREEIARGILRTYEC